jgi:hypothetical protein
MSFSPLAIYFMFLTAVVVVIGWYVNRSSRPLKPAKKK